VARLNIAIIWTAIRGLAKLVPSHDVSKELKLMIIALSYTIHPIHHLRKAGRRTQMWRTGDLLINCFPNADLWA
jgi:hypothetical protein